MAKENNLKDFLTDLADAIREKKGTTDLINPQDFSAEIASIETDGDGEGGGGGASVQAKDVNFRDYDGTILHSYTKTQLLALAEMPTLPTRQGLTCQGWNYSLEDAKAYVEEYGKLDVGATYITDDGKTRLYITIVSEGRMDVPLRLQQTVSNGVVVDWGDGSATETFTGTSATTLRHNYGKVGDYVITLEVTSGILKLSGSTNYGIFADSMKVYSNMLQKVEIGNGVTSIGNYAFNFCYSLASVVIPSGVSIGDYAFRNCYSLASVVIPSGVSIGIYAFYYCYALASVVIPRGVTSIGTYTFYYCFSLASVVIPSGVTSIGNYAFGYCYSLASVVIPSGVTSIGNYVFYNDQSLSSVVIPSGVTSIGDYAFQSCYSLASVAIPSGVTSIGKYVFNGCSSVAYFDFRTHTSVPTLTATNAFSSNASDYKIVVPDALYDEWIAATNWSSLASNIVKASNYTN